MKNFLRIIFVVLISTANIHAEIVPVSLDLRVEEAQYLVMGQVIRTHSYWDQNKENIYTLHEIQVDGYFKGQHSATHLGLISMGGQVGLDMQETFPSVHLSVGDYGVFMLGGQAPASLCAADYESKSSNFIQAFATASVQGVVSYQNGRWLDASRPDQSMSTQEFMKKISSLTGTSLIDYLGNKIELPKKLTSNHTFSTQKTLAVTTLQNGSLATTNTFNSGVSNNPSMEMIINGSGFGSSTGSINFPNANAGGGANTFVFPTTTTNAQSRQGAPSDIISWTNNQIRIRVPRAAGTGTMEVFNSANVSQGTAPITIDWAILPLYSDFALFPVRTSQFVKLIEDNTTGGYLFQMSTAGSATFFGNVAAKEAVRRAMNTWRCGTSINWDLDLTAGTAAGFANDGTNVVIFDNTLSTGVLARCTSRSTASGNGACNMHDTYWRLQEVDLQFRTTPTATTTWNFNSTGTASNQYSFESVALHELGHGHGLGHVVDVTKVMHFSIANGVENVSLATSDVAAGNYRINTSVGPNCFATPAVMTPLVNPCIPLAVNLISFEGYLQGKDNHLVWRTTNEKDMKEFTIERSSDGSRFNSIGTVPSKRNSSDNEYVFYHKDPSSNINFYRLAMLDLEGRITYSEVVRLVRTDKSNRSLQPNPTKNLLFITLNGMSKKDNKISYTLTDVNGRQLESKQEITSNSSTQLTVNLKQWPAGMYFINLMVNGKRSSHKIVKQ